MPLSNIDRDTCTNPLGTANSDSLSVPSPSPPPPVSMNTSPASCQHSPAKRPAPVPPPVVDSGGDEGKLNDPNNPLYIIWDLDETLITFQAILTEDTNHKYNLATPLELDAAKRMALSLCECIMEICSSYCYFNSLQFCDLSNCSDFAQYESDLGMPASMQHRLTAQLLSHVRTVYRAYPNKDRFPLFHSCVPRHGSRILAPIPSLLLNAHTDDSTMGCLAPTDLDDDEGHEDHPQQPSPLGSPWEDVHHSQTWPLHRSPQLPSPIGEGHLDMTCWATLHEADGPAEHSLNIPLAFPSPSPPSTLHHPPAHSTHPPDSSLTDSDSNSPPSTTREGGAKSPTKRMKLQPSGQRSPSGPSSCGSTDASGNPEVTDDNLRAAAAALTAAALNHIDHPTDLPDPNSNENATNGLHAKSDANCEWKAPTLPLLALGAPRQHGEMFGCVDVEDTPHSPEHGVDIDGIIKRIDDISSGWLRRSQCMLDELTQKLNVRFYLVTSCQLIPAIVKLCIFGLQPYFDVQRVYSSSAKGKLESFKRVLEVIDAEAGGEERQIIAVGDGQEERAAAMHLNLRFFPITGIDDLEHLKQHLLKEPLAPLDPHGHSHPPS